MADTITAVSRCAGLNHIRLSVNNGVATRIIGFELGDFTRAAKLRDLVEQHPEEADLLYTLRKAIKTAGASTYAQARTAILNQTFDTEA